MVEHMRAAGEKLRQMGEGFPAKVVFSLFATVVSFITQTFGHLIWAVLAMLLLDTITGMQRALCLKEFSSQMLRKFYVKLTAVLPAIVMLLIIKGAAEDPTPFAVLLTAVYWYFIFDEAVSILEHLQARGVKVPQFLDEALRASREKMSTLKEKT